MSQDGATAAHDVSTDTEEILTIMQQFHPLNEKVHWVTVAVPPGCCSRAQ